MKAGVFGRWAAGVFVLGGVAAYLAGSGPVASQQAGPAAGKCQPGPNTLGVSRVVDIDATRGPRFGAAVPRS